MLRGNGSAENYIDYERYIKKHLGTYGCQGV